MEKREQQPGVLQETAHDTHKGMGPPVDSLASESTVRATVLVSSAVPGFCDALVFDIKSLTNLLINTKKLT